VLLKAQHGIPARAAHLTAEREAQAVGQAMQQELALFVGLAGRAERVGRRVLRVVFDN
jgi:hypothetical protein